MWSYVLPMRSLTTLQLHDYFNRERRKFVTSITKTCAIVVKQSTSEEDWDKIIDKQYRSIRGYLAYHTKSAWASIIVVNCSDLCQVF